MRKCGVRGVIGHAMLSARQSPLLALCTKDGTIVVTWRIVWISHTTPFRLTEAPSLCPKSSAFPQTFMQPPGATAAGMAPFSGAGSSDGPGTAGAGIGLETDEPITSDQSPTAARNPYLDRVREGSGLGSGSLGDMPIRRERSGSPDVPAVTPGGV